MLCVRSFVCTIKALFLCYFIPIFCFFLSMSVTCWSSLWRQWFSAAENDDSARGAGRALSHCHIVTPAFWGEARMEGWRSKGKKGRGTRAQWERKKESGRIEGRRNHRLLWRPILQASLPRPTLQDILDSSTLPRPPPLQLLSFLSSFSCSPPFWFPTRQAFSRTLERCKSITMSTVPFTLTHSTNTSTGSHTHELAQKNGVDHLQEGH